MTWDFKTELTQADEKHAARIMAEGIERWLETLSTEEKQTCSSAS